MLTIEDAQCALDDTGLFDRTPITSHGVSAITTGRLLIRYTRYATPDTAWHRLDLHLPGRMFGGWREPSLTISRIEHDDYLTDRRQLADDARDLTDWATRLLNIETLRDLGETIEAETGADYETLADGFRLTCDGTSLEAHAVNTTDATPATLIITNHHKQHTETTLTTNTPDPDRLARMLLRERTTA